MFIFDGGQAAVSNSNLTSTGSSAVVVQGAGSAIDLTGTTINANTPPAVIGFGLRVTSGASAAMTGGSISTAGRDSPGIHAASATVTATNVAVTTTGADNAIGALADQNGQLTLVGGSVTTSGDAVRTSSFPHAVAARGPGAILTATGTTLVTTGLIAMGAVADDGGTVILRGNTITTHGEKSIGLYAVTEQVGAQFPANLTATSVTVETFGLSGHGVTAQARNDVPVEKATATINSSTVLTHGGLAAGLRAVLGDYGTRPILGRGEAAVVANDSTVRTEGVSAYGRCPRDNPTSVTMNRTSVLTTGQFGAQFGRGSWRPDCRQQFDNHRAGQQRSRAFYAVGSPTAVSTGIFTNTELLQHQRVPPSVSPAPATCHSPIPAPPAAANGRVGTSANFPALAPPEPRSSECRTPTIPVLRRPSTLPPPTVTAPTPGLANVTLEAIRP